MINDELQTRIAEQKKLAEDKKKLLQNLKNLEQVEKEVRVEIDKILPEKTKFEEWAKYFGNDGKSDQVLNWFGDELKKLKAKLDRVQGMRSKILAVQEQIDSQLDQLNLEIVNYKNLPPVAAKPVQDELQPKSIQIQTPEVASANKIESQFDSGVAAPVSPGVPDKPPKAPDLPKPGVDQPEAPKPIVPPKPVEKSVPVPPKPVPEAAKPVVRPAEAPKPIVPPKPVEKSVPVPPKPVPEAAKPVVRPAEAPKPIVPPKPVEKNVPVPPKPVPEAAKPVVRPAEAPKPIVPPKPAETSVPVPPKPVPEAAKPVVRPAEAPKPIVPPKPAEKSVPVPPKPVPEAAKLIVRPAEAPKPIVPPKPVEKSVPVPPKPVPEAAKPVVRPAEAPKPIVPPKPAETSVPVPPKPVPEAAKPVVRPAEAPKPIVPPKPAEKSVPVPPKPVPEAAKLIVRPAEAPKPIVPPKPVEKSVPVPPKPVPEAAKPVVRPAEAPKPIVPPKPAETSVPVPPKPVPEATKPVVRPAEAPKPIVPPKPVEKSVPVPPKPVPEAVKPVVRPAEAPKPIVPPKPVETSVPVPPKPVPEAAKPVVRPAEAPKPIVPPKPVETSVPVPPKPVPEAAKPVVRPVEASKPIVPPKPVETSVPVAAKPVALQPEIPKPMAPPQPAEKSVAVLPQTAEILAMPEKSAAAGSETVFSPEHKNLLQDIAKRAKITAEKMAAESKEKPLPGKPNWEAAEQTQTSAGKSEMSPQKPDGSETAPEKIAAKPAGSERSPEKNIEPESASQLDPTLHSGSGTPPENEKTHGEKSDKTFSQKMKEQKQNYINQQPVREHEVKPAKSSEILDEKGVIRAGKESAADIPEKRGILSSLKDKFFDKTPVPEADKPATAESALKAATSDSLKSNLADFPNAVAQPLPGVRDKSAPSKIEKNIDARSIFDEPAPESRIAGTSPQTSSDEIKIDPKSLPVMPVEPKKSGAPEKSIPPVQPDLKIQPIPQSSKAEPKQEVIDAQSILTEPAPVTKTTGPDSAKKEAIADKPEPISQQKASLPGVTEPVVAIPPSVPALKPEISRKPEIQTPASSEFVETESFLFDSPGQAPVTAAAGAQHPAAKSDLKPEFAASESTYPEETVAKSVEHPPATPAVISKSDILYLGIDLGTYETTIAGSNGEIATVVSAVGWPKDLISRNLLKKEVLFGDEAFKHKLALRFYRPLAEGVIKNTEEDLAAATELIKYVLTKLHPEKYKKVYAVIGAPAQANLHNEQAIFDAAREVIDAVTIVSEPFAVAYGEANIYNTLVIDIGAGTTDLCRLRGTMPEEGDQITLIKAGDYIDAQLVEALEQRIKGVQVTKDMARRWKEAYSFVMNPPKPVVIEVTVDGKPLRVDISTCIQKSCEMIVDDIADSARKLISTFDPEFQMDLKQNIILAGGGSLIQNLDVYLTQKLNMLGKVNIKKVTNPIEAGARGALALAMDVTDDFWRGLS